MKASILRDELTGLIHLAQNQGRLALVSQLNDILIKIDEDQESQLTRKRSLKTGTVVLASMDIACRDFWETSENSKNTLIAEIVAAL